MNETIKRCACKGIRSCLVCERKGCYDVPSFVKNNKAPGHAQLKFSKKDEPVVNFHASSCIESEAVRVSILNDSQSPFLAEAEAADTWHYCIECKDKAYKYNTEHEYHKTDDKHVIISGVFVQPNFLSASEELQIVAGIDEIPWVDSQSGRRKQDFGPKVNFKRKKLKLDPFHGFPVHSKTVLDRMRTIDVLSGFKPVEMCNLEYEPSKGAAIDPHYDDFWLWGERLVTINLLSTTFYTLSQPDSTQRIIVPLPSRSLIVLHADSRYKWMHSIAREHIYNRRIGITIRELTPEFLEGGASASIGQQLLSKAVVMPIDPP